MPVFLRYSSYKVFFWTNENGEPIHFHIAEGAPSANSTKVWVLSDGSFNKENDEEHSTPYTLLDLDYEAEDVIPFSLAREIRDF